MALFKRMARIVLGLDDTETSDQEKFIKDLYASQKSNVRKIEKQHTSAFLESLMEKQDLIGFGLIRNKQILMSSEDFKKKEIQKLIGFFDFVKDSLKEKVVMLHGSPWITMFRRDGYLFITKKEVKLNDIEINAITHDVLNAKELYVDEKVPEEIAYENKKRIYQIKN